MIKYIKGDLFKAEQDVIAHGCNCRNGFGSGVAGIMAKKHPLAKQAFHAKYASNGWALGEVQFVYSHDKIIANCATQLNYNPATGPHADYKAIEVCMLKLLKFAKQENKTIAIPKIGAGLAGGDWERISKIINDVFEDTDIYVYYL